jgi:hypothetical protein
MTVGLMLLVVAGTVSLVALIGGMVPLERPLNVAVPLLCFGSMILVAAEIDHRVSRRMRARGVRRLSRSR